MQVTSSFFAVRISGVIINTPSEFAEIAGRELLNGAIEAFKGLSSIATVLFAKFY